MPSAGIGLCAVCGQVMQGSRGRCGCLAAGNAGRGPLGCAFGLASARRTAFSGSGLGLGTGQRARGCSRSLSRCRAGFCAMLGRRSGRRLSGGIGRGRSLARPSLPVPSAGSRPSSPGRRSGFRHDTNSLMFSRRHRRRPGTCHHRSGMAPARQGCPQEGPGTLVQSAKIGLTLSNTPPRGAPPGAPSSKGKTTDSDSVNRGSNPRGASNFVRHLIEFKQIFDNLLGKLPHSPPRPVWARRSRGSRCLMSPNPKPKTVMPSYEPSGALAPVDGRR